MTTKLSPADIDALSGRAKRYEVPCEKGHPLWIRVEPKGSKTFVCRTRIGGKNVRKTIGKVSEWKLTEAKRKARIIDEDARLNGGADHLAEAKAVVEAQVSTQRETVEWAWRAYMDREGSHLVSAKEKRTHWTRSIAPAWGQRMLNSITKRDIVSLLDAELESARLRKETGTSANNLHKTVKRFLNWSMGQGYLDANPAIGIEKRIDESLHRRPPRPLNDQELVWLFRALDQHKGRRADAAELLLRSVCRLATIYDADRINLCEAGLLLPKTKNGTPFMLPLTATMRALAGEPGNGLIFPGNLTYKAKLIESLRETMTASAAEDGFNGTFVGEFFEGRKRNPHYWSAHDFRDTATMWFKNQRTETGMPIYPKEVREAMLNHRSRSVEATHYNDDASDPFWEYAPRKFAGAAWNAHLDAVKVEALSRTDD